MNTKKLLALALAAALILVCFAACGKNTSENTGADEETSAQGKDLSDKIADALAEADEKLDNADLSFGELEEEFGEIKTEYDALSDEEKAACTGFDELEQKLERLGSYAALRDESAAAYYRGFNNTVNLEGGYTPEKLFCITEYLSVTNDGGTDEPENETKVLFTFAIVCQNADGSEETFYANVRFGQKDGYIALVNDPEKAYAAAPTAGCDPTETGDELNLETIAALSDELFG